MISILIASVVLAAATGLFQTSASTRNIVKNLSELQEEAFFISHTLRQQFAQTGYRGIDPIRLGGGRTPIPSRAETFQSVDADWAAGQLIRFSANGLSFRFGGASAVDGTADGSIFDCHGTPKPFGTVTETQLSLQSGRLVCTVGGTSETLLGAAGGTQVEQVAYSLGVDTNGDGGIDTEVAAGSASAADFQNTEKLTMRLLLATPDNTIQHKQTYRYNGVDTQASDNRLRSEVVVSVAIRN